MKKFKQFLKTQPQAQYRHLTRPGEPFQTGLFGPASDVRYLDKKKWRWDNVQRKLVKIEEQQRRRKRPGDLLRTNTPGNANVYRLPIATSDEKEWYGSPGELEYQR